MINLIADIVIVICLLALFTAILINFFERDKSVHKQTKSIVETVSMTGFFLLFYLLVRFRIGAIELREFWQMLLTPAGLLLLIAGTCVNLKGRRDLGKNWANQVTLYTHQQLVEHGVYKYIRHPLYSSIIAMFYGACLVYPNYLAFLSTSLIFVPFMIYRAKQEEKLLTQNLSGYTDYRKRTGMFIPKIIRHERNPH